MVRPGSALGGASLQALGPEALSSPPASSQKIRQAEDDYISQEVVTCNSACSIGDESISVKDMRQMVIPQGDFDDDETIGYDEEPPAQLDSHVAWSCTRGEHGVLGVSISQHQASMCLARTARLAETLSSPTAVHGTCRKWAKGATIGQGSLGLVFEAMDQSTGQVFAVKELSINTADKDDMKFKDALENEVSICAALDHPNIVRYFGHDYMDSQLYIYLEYCIGGSMSGVLKQFGMLEESLIHVYARDLLMGLAYLHTHQPPVVHRDIKGANVLMAEDASVERDLRAKLSDFGCSKRAEQTLSNTMRGSIPWMAPEVIRNTGYGRAADIWSFGCVLVEMASAKSPWGKFDNPMAAMCKIGMSKETPPVPEQLSDLCKDLIGRCLQRDPSDRPTAKSLVEHAFLREKVLDM